VSWPARDSLARLTASRRFVFTRSPGFIANERGSHHQALVAEALEQSVEPISRRACFVAKRQMTVFRCNLGHEYSDRRLGGRELPEIPHLAATAASGNCCCITRF
jgi:hypothetical protein